ncbi:hypothetical protein KBB12_01245, partial [Candidatus Woesebacteria bacterium]|nr:hypothetical protein [Candidatus Woesebacteria bacterium]
MNKPTTKKRPLVKDVLFGKMNLLRRALIVLGMLLGITILIGFTRYSDIFATAQSVVTKSTDADFSQGTLSNLQINGSGGGAYLDLTGGSNWWNSSYTYRRQLTIDITGNASLTSGYTVFASIGGADASTIYSNSLTSGDDFRVVYFDGATSTELVRDVTSFASGDISFYFKTQALLSGNDTTHYFVYYGYAGATSPIVDKTQVYNNTYNAALSSNGGIATASDIYASNPITQVNNGVVGGGAGSVGWGNNNQAGSRVMIKLPSTTKVWKVEQRWDGDSTGGWAKPAGTYFPTSYKVQYTTSSGAVASDASGSVNWDSLQVSTNSLSVSRTDASGSPSYPGVPSISVDTITTNLSGCTNCWGTVLANTFKPVDVLSVRYAYGNTGWVGTMEEFYVFPINATQATVEPTLSVATQTTNLAPSGSWESATNSNVIDLTWNAGWGDGTAGSTAFSADIANVSPTSTISFAIRTASSPGGLTGASYLDMGTATTGTSFTKTKAELDGLGVPTGTSRYVQVKVVVAQTSGQNPQLNSFSLYYLSDNTGPSSNASSISMQRMSGGPFISPSGWTGGSQPYFSYTQGVDPESGLKGYCIYLGTDSLADPGTTKGMLGTSPVSTTGSTCQFIVS